jgi:hypothetical protein
VICTGVTSDPLQDGEISGLVLHLEVFMNWYRGVARWDGRFGQYGITVSFWGSGTLKIVILVENHPQKRFFRLADYHPLKGWGC